MTRSGAPAQWLWLSGSYIKKPQWRAVDVNPRVTDRNRAGSAAAGPHRLGYGEAIDRGKPHRCHAPVWDSSCVFAVIPRCRVRGKVHEKACAALVWWSGFGRAGMRIYPQVDMPGELRRHTLLRRGGVFTVAWKSRHSPAEFWTPLSLILT
jgi:hypothetical protein